MNRTVIACRWKAMVDVPPGKPSLTGTSVEAVGGESFLRLTNALLLFLGSLYIFYTLPEIKSFASTVDDLTSNLLIFLALTAFALLSVRPRLVLAREKKLDAIRLALQALLVVFVIAFPTFIGIELRHQTGDVQYANDHALQIEEAANFFLHGQNPYTADYSGTSAHLGGGLGEPALTHFVSLPFTFLVAAPFLSLEDALLGWHDERLLHLLAYVFAAVILLSLARGSEPRLLVGTLFFFNPFLALTFIHGYTDILLIALLFLSGWLLSRRAFFASSVVLGLALASHQFALFFAGFFFIYLFAEGDPAKPFGRRLRLAVVRFLPAVVVATLLIAPFFLSAPSAFLDDTFRYAAGSLPTSYPIRGFGLSQALLANGVISPNATVPFGVMELFIVLPLTLLFGEWVYRRHSVSAVFFASGIVTLAFLYFSRNLQVNYPGFTFALMTAGLALASRERPPAYAE